MCGPLANATRGVRDASPSPPACWIDEAPGLDLSTLPLIHIQIRHVRRWLQSLGLNKYIDVVPGPLIRATRNGEPDKPSHMPLATASTYTHLCGAVKKAYELVQSRGEPDTELDLEGRDKPKFGNHGNRRYADKKALDTREQTGVSMEVHNDHFGWAQKKQRKESALHYHGRTERLERAKVTSLF